LIVATEIPRRAAVSRVADRNTTIPAILYVVGFACEVSGGAIVPLGLPGGARPSKCLLTDGVTREWIDMSPDAMRGAPELPQALIATRVNKVDGDRYF
jgi:hypothetical protein